MLRTKSTLKMHNVINKNLNYTLTQINLFIYNAVINYYDGAYDVQQIYTICAITRVDIIIWYIISNISLYILHVVYFLNIQTKCTYVIEYYS